LPQAFRCLLCVNDQHCATHLELSHGQPAKMLSDEFYDPTLKQHLAKTMRFDDPQTQRAKTQERFAHAHARCDLHENPNRNRIQHANDPAVQNRQIHKW
jgi:hypothetical protein